MAEYIEREKAIERISPHVKPTTVYGEGYMQAIEHAVDILELMPAADVQPVKRGEWGKRAYNRVQCSYCGKCEDIATDFCPNCGAKMSTE